MKITEGYMDFKGLKTYYRIAGEQKNGRKPLLMLHGGPGSTHNYFEVLDELAEDGRQLITYDQIGCGKSPAVGRKDLFNRETWVEELTCLRNYLGIDMPHIMGQSWGGMLLLEYVCGSSPKDVSSIILASTLPSSALWAEEQHRMIKELPKEMQDAIKTAEETGNYSGKGYEAANREFMLRHCGPEFGAGDRECLTRKKPACGREPYETAWGPNEFTPLGNLKDFDRTADLCNIKIPTLVTSGVNDLCTPLIAKTMYDAIPGAKWELFRYSRHMSHVEETPKYINILRKFMEEHD